MAKAAKKDTKVKIKKVDTKKGEEVKGGALRRLR
jgi:hypothetical protein